MIISKDCEKKETSEEDIHEMMRDNWATQMDMLGYNVDGTKRSEHNGER